MLISRSILIASSAALLIGLLALGSYIYSDLRPTTESSDLLCSGPEQAASRVLVVGDSWTSGQKLDAGFARDRYVCSLSYPGLTSEEILASLQSDPDLPNQIRSAVRPTSVVIVGGVNDAAQHRGAAYYASFMSALNQHLLVVAPGSRVYILELPWASAVLGPVSAVKYQIYACLFDGCQQNVTTQYRAALERARPTATIIPFDGFMRGHDAAQFKADGVHLLPTRSADLAIYLAANVPV